MDAAVSSGTAGGDNIFGNNNDSIRFTSIIRQSIADLCDKTAVIKTVSKRTGNVPDDVVLKSYEDFVFSVQRLYEYTREMLPEEMINRINSWDRQITFPSVAKKLSDDERAVMQKGLRISEDLQTIMYKKGLKDPVAPSDFDFERYYEISKEYDPESVESPEEFDMLEQGYDIIGYSSSSEYSYMYSSFVNHSMILKSSGRYDDARVFFYGILPTFAPIFDRPFIENCIKIKKMYASKIDAGGKGVHNQIYQLHEAEFSALMNRASILHQPDIMDTRLPDYTPASVPGGVANK